MSEEKLQNPVDGVWYNNGDEPLSESPCEGCKQGLRRSHTVGDGGAIRQFHLVRQGLTMDCIGLDYRMQEMFKNVGTPEYPLPDAPPWHVDDVRLCAHGWTDGTTWSVCDCEDPANPWPPRVQGDGPRDCRCFGCHDAPRPMRGRVAGCEYKDHHCPDCHEHQRCTLLECVT